MKILTLTKKVKLAILTLLALFFIGCGELVDNGIYGFTLNEIESEQMQGRLQNPPADKARIYVIVDYAYSSIWSLTSDLKEFQPPAGHASIMLKTEAQVKSKAQAAWNFGYIRSGIFSVDIVPSSEAIYLYKEQSGASRTVQLFGNANAPSDGWETKLVPRAGQIHCLSLYQRALKPNICNGVGGKMIVTRKENVIYPVIWAEKKDCMILVNRLYNDKVEFETKNKGEKAKLKAQRIERENELRKERGYSLVEEKEQNSNDNWESH